MTPIHHEPPFRRCGSRLSVGILAPHRPLLHHVHRWAREERRFAARDRHL